MMLTWWMISRERNAHMFDNGAINEDQLTNKIMQGLHYWHQARITAVAPSSYTSHLELASFFFPYYEPVNILLVFPLLCQFLLMNEN